MAIRRSRDKKFLGFLLKSSPNLSRVWMNEDVTGDPFICIAHRVDLWEITVAVNKYRFEGKGHTESKARIDFANNFVALRQAIGLVDSWASRE
jgi:hypothetical protein